jgi:hypothetical protein
LGPLEDLSFHLADTAVERFGEMVLLPFALREANELWDVLHTMNNVTHFPLWP